MKNLQRAVTDKEKEEILKRLEEVWKKNPELRLGQLIGNVYHVIGSPQYYVEDYDLITALEKFYKEQ